MMVSDPSSRIPPRTLSFSPLITELTVITVMIPITIPRDGQRRPQGILPQRVDRQHQLLRPLDGPAARHELPKRQHAALRQNFADRRHLTAFTPSATLPPDRASPLSTPDRSQKTGPRSTPPPARRAPTITAPRSAAATRAKPPSPPTPPGSPQAH